MTALATTPSSMIGTVALSSSLSICGALVRDLGREALGHPPVSDFGSLTPLSQVAQKPSGQWNSCVP